MDVMKFCGICHTEKLISEFGKRTASHDGLSTRCRDCQRKYDKDRANNPDRVAARAAYAKTDSGRLASSRAKKKYADSHRKEASDRCKEYRAQNPKKSRSHDLVAYAIRIGALTRMPCEVCGGDSHVAHHDDYDKPLDVRWLCATHHRQWHAEKGPGANAE